MIDKIIPFSIMNYLFAKYNKNSNIDSQDLNKLREISGGTEQLKEALAILRENGSINKNFDISVTETPSGIPDLELKKNLNIENILTKKAVETYYSTYMKNLVQIEAMQKFNRIINSTNNINKQNESNKEEIRRRAYAEVLKSLNNSNDIRDYNEENIDKEKKDKNQPKKFIGILGENCGKLIKPTGEEEKRVIKKGFKVEKGITVLRGFAKSSDLATYSKKDENYQRISNDEHLKNIKQFVENIRPSAKYLPEVTLVARGYEKLERIKLSGKLSDTQQGELDNLEYYELSVSKDNLYRIDGNHRLEALKDKNYYIPFSIIIWNNESVSVDDEAFLFYFLNSKAKPLTTEENLKGLVNSTTWELHELKEANKYLPHLIHLNKALKNEFISHYLIDNEPIKNISNILNKIEEKESVCLEEDLFKTILKLTNELITLDKWSYLKQFNFYCQLIFYIAYKHKDRDICITALDNINNWVKRYNFDNTSFNDPIMLYSSAEKTNNINPIRIFMAMPYYDDGTIDDFNEQLKKLKEELIKKYPNLKNRLEIFKIMKHRGYAIDVQKQIMEQIKSTNIFIADISEHKCKKGRKNVDSHANPNVMYELGLAKNQSHTKIILLKKEEDKIPVPSDLITKYHNKFSMTNRTAMRKKLLEAIENILKDEFKII